MTAVRGKMVRKMGQKKTAVMCRHPEFEYLRVVGRKKRGGIKKGGVKKRIIG